MHNGRITGVLLSSLAVSCCCQRRTRPERLHRRRQGHIRRGAARRDGRSVEPRAHRENAIRRSPTATVRIASSICVPACTRVTFTLEGFSTVKREAIELSSDFTMTLNADMKVGALEETLTVTGASPVVDVQSTTKSQVLRAKCSTRCRPAARFRAWGSSSPASR